MHRPTNLALALLLLTCLSCVCFAQRGARCDPASLHVKVLYSNSRSARSHTEVDLLTSSMTLITRKFTDDGGSVDFNSISAGNYRLRVSDLLVDDSVTDEVALTCGETRAELVTAKLKADAENEIKQEEAKEAMVNAMELNVPGGAKKEFQKGAEAMQDGDNATALKHFLKAIDLYPKYALAYNHLGVVYMQMNQEDKGREAFEKAVELDDHYPSALVNLAKLRFKDRKMQEVEDLLRKAVAGDPQNAEALAILADAELVNGHVDAAMANIAKLQPLPHQQYASIHLVAADTLARSQRNDEALAQYSLYLQEGPSPQGGDRARKAIAQLKGAPPSR